MRVYKDLSLRYITAVQRLLHYEVLPVSQLTKVGKCKSEVPQTGGNFVGMMFVIHCCGNKRQLFLVCVASHLGPEHT